MASSPLTTAARISSCISAASRATASRPSRRARRWSSCRSRARRVRRRPTWSSPADALWARTRRPRRRAVRSFVLTRERCGGQRRQGRVAGRDRGGVPRRHVPHRPRQRPRDARLRLREDAQVPHPDQPGRPCHRRALALRPDPRPHHVQAALTRSRAAYAPGVRPAPPVLWAPDQARIERATLTRYARRLAERGVETDGYHDLWRWSVENLEEFWASIWETFDVRASSPYERVLGRRTMPGAEWFPGARLNFAEHVFRGREPGAVAIRHASELRSLAETTWGELEEETSRIAAALRASGVGPGDRVVAYVPNVAEAVVAFLACASIGAIWSSCSPDFGARSAVDRFAQIEPRVLFAVDGYRYGGRD